MTTNALSIYNQFDQIQRAAIALFKSGYFKDATSEAQAIVKVMAGAEIGIPPFASMSGIHIILGKPVLGANVIATLVKNDPRYDYKIKRSDSVECVLQWYENRMLVGEAGFTIEEAKAAGLTGKDNWTKFPSDMLFARAISRGARRFAPGIFGGSPVYTPDELGADTDEEGMIDTSFQPIESKTHEQPEQQYQAQSELPIAPPPAPKETNGKDAIYQAVVDAGLSENVHSAKSTLTHYCQTGYDTAEKALAWFRLYRGWRDLDNTPQDAGRKANAGEVPQ